MAIIVPTRRLQIAKNGDYATSRFTLDAKTDWITLRIGRETTGGSRVFSPSSRIQTRIIVRAGTQDFLAIGSVTGGIYPGDPGEEIGKYSLAYGLPRGFFGDTIKQHRLGETVSTFDVLVELLLDGDPIDTDFTVESSESEAPTARHHSSVAYDNATDEVEVTGDGVFSLSHSASGSDRAVFMGVGAGINNVSSTSFTYAGNAGTELWDIDGGFQNLAGYYLAGDSNVPTGSQTATSTLSGSTGRRQIITVISMTGVDSSTPVGTAQTRSSASNQTSSSLTVTDLDGDGMIVDLLMVGNGSDPANSVGANQTERSSTNENSSGNGRVSTSTQSSADGGVMSWTFGGSAGGNAHGAVEFKPATGGGGGGASGRDFMLLGVGT